MPCTVMCRCSGTAQEIVRGSHMSRPATIPNRTPATPITTLAARRRRGALGAGYELCWSMGRLGMSKIASAGTAP